MSKVKKKTRYFYACRGETPWMAIKMYDASFGTLHTNKKKLLHHARMDKSRRLYKMTVIIEPLENGVADE